MRRFLRRFWIPLYLVAALCLMATAFVMWERNRPAPTPRNLEKVQIGMTPSEVEAILGKDFWEPPGNRSGWQVHIYAEGDQSQGFLVQVNFVEGRVVDKISGFLDPTPFWMTSARRSGSSKKQAVGCQPLRGLRLGNRVELVWRQAVLFRFRYHPPA